MMQPTLGLDAACAVTWDAIVLGGGPAGALAARQLATGGARVLLVDKKPFPRSKVCGACLNGQALSVLRAVGLGNLVADLGGIPLDTFELRLADQSAQLSLPAGAALSRARLDAALVSAAISAGAEFLPETRASVDGVESNMRRVVLTRDGQSRMASARVVLVAAGLAHTCLARDPTFQTRTRAGSRIGAGCVLERFPDFFRERTIFMAVGRHGYVGLVRLEDGLLNIGAALDRSFVKRSSGPGSAAMRVLAEARFPVVSRLAEAAWSGTAALTTRTWPLAAERLFLLGDAAGYVEPFTGEGIAWALISAQAIEPLVRQGIECWDPALQRAWPALERRLVGRRQRLCRLLALVLGHPWLARSAFRVSARVPQLPRILINHVNAPSALSRASYS